MDNAFHKALKGLQSPFNRVKKYRKTKLYYNQKKCVLSIYFGPPGSGKTTMACALARKTLKKGFPVFSNVPIKGTYKLNPRTDLGFFMVKSSLILIDECSIEYNNRDFKNFPVQNIEFFKYHRHYETEIACFSQSWDDIDITLRRLAQNVYYVRRTILPWFIKVVKIKKTFSFVDGQIVDAYEPVKFSARFVFTPPLHKMFNTLARTEYPEKDWESYN